MKRILCLMLILGLVISFGMFSCAKKEPQEIRIGAILPLTGDAALYGETAKNSIELAKNEINNRGGINAMAINVIYEDTQAKPELATQAVNKLITVDKVTVVLGAMSSSEVLAIAPILNQKRVVLVSPSATSHDISKAGDYIFRTIVSDEYDGVAMAVFAHDEKEIQKVSMLYVTEAGPQGVAQAFERRFKALGGQIVSVEVCSRGDNDLRSQIAKINADDSQAVYFALYPRESEVFLKQAKELGLKKLLLSHQLIDDPQVLSRVGNAAEGVLFTTPKIIPEAGGEAVKHFHDSYLAKYHKEPQNFAANSYDALMLVAEAIKKYGVGADSVKEGLYDVKDYHGASGMLSMDKNGDVEQKMAIMVIKGSRPVVYSEK